MKDRKRYGSKRLEQSSIARDKYRKTEIGYARTRADSSIQTAKKRGAEIDPAFDRLAMGDWFIAQKVCNHCKLSLLPKQKKIDHIIAIIAGGKHEESNVQILCDECHKLKSQLDVLAIWLARKDMYANA